jgi:hypothetical protein
MGLSVALCDFLFSVRKFNLEGVELQTETEGERKGVGERQRERMMMRTSERGALAKMTATKTRRNR